MGTNESQKRYVVEGTWSGYRASQERVCHRRVVKGKRKAEALKKVTHIVFTDGTNMTIRVREALPREKVLEIAGYDELLFRCLMGRKEGFVHVDEL